ncbi:hypothetical protein V6N13_130718 [Hibiscus sabdariffa]|uniref:Acyl-CoA N-acyltransferase n=1 Tax=Hibiscus sabdariffa TaxID=183260 RepID=A0ABR2NZZ1_9ROSI
MELPHMVAVPKFFYPSPRFWSRTQTISSSQLSASPLQSSSNQTTSNGIKEAAVDTPSMSDILASSKAQNLDLQLQTLGPFFRITAKALETNRELGRAEGFIRIWFGAIRYGYDCGCKTAELLAINDSDLYHSKLVRFYRRIGFKAVHEVTGSTIGDVPHMLIWGGIGTRMDASIDELLVKWCTRFKSQSNV